MTPDRRRNRLNDLQDVGASLRQPVDAPDFTSMILSRVHEERPFLKTRARRWVLISRAVLGVSVLSVLLGVALVQRFGGDSVKLVNDPAPLCDVVRCVECETAAGLGSIRQTVSQFAEVQPETFLTVFSSAAGSTPATESGPSLRCCRSEPFVGPAMPLDIALKVPGCAGNVRCEEARLAIARLKSAQPGQSPWPRPVLSDLTTGLHFSDSAAVGRALSPDEGAFPK